MAGNLERIVTGVIGPEAAAYLSSVLAVPVELREESSPSPSRAVLAEALNIVLFQDLLDRVPDAAAYVNDCIRQGIAVKHDHGAVRTVALSGMGTLPGGQDALLRVLLPLGYALNGTYPLDRLKMTGRSYAHVDYPEDIAQFFVSELYPERFSAEFQAAVARVTASSKDPLTPQVLHLLDRVAQGESLTVEEATTVVGAGAKAFARHHATPSLRDYEILLQESAEMAWISTEGNAFNHITDRVADVQRLSEEQKRLGRPMKDTVEISGSGRVKQTAFRAAIVQREFVDEHGATVTRDVPGSFIEFITREHMPDDTKLDLGFDSSNAQAIFKMTATK